MRTPPVESEAWAAGAELMGRYCDGDGTAFHALYRELAPRLLGYLNRLCRDAATAEDLLQLTFLKLHRGRATYVRGANPVPWLYAIARATCLDELRRRRRGKVQLAVEPLAVPELPVHLTGGVDTPSETSSDPAAGAALRALERLPPRQRAALVMTKLEGRPLAEVAASTGTTVGAVKLRIHRGYTRLRKILGSKHRDAAKGA